ncbi:hypothetical protein EMIT0196P_30307 [Pseudomonas chlororaphis]
MRRVVMIAPHTPHALMARVVGCLGSAARAAFGNHLLARVEGSRCHNYTAKRHATRNRA